MTMLDHDLAGRTNRLIARYIDTTAAGFLTGFSGLLLNFSTTISQMLGCFGFLLAILYIFCADGLKGGQSYGKKIMKICVIDATSGEPCTFTNSFIRSTPLVLLGIIDWMFIFSNKRQRLGDIIANTIVVKKKGRSERF